MVEFQTYIHLYVYLIKWWIVIYICRYNNRKKVCGPLTLINHFTIIIIIILMRYSKREGIALNFWSDLLLSFQHYKHKRYSILFPPQLTVCHYIYVPSILFSFSTFVLFLYISPSSIYIYIYMPISLHYSLNYRNEFKNFIYIYCYYSN